MVLSNLSMYVSSLVFEYRVGDDLRTFENSSIQMESEKKAQFSRISAINEINLILNKKGSQKARKNALISLSQTKLYPDAFITSHDFLEK